MKKIILKNLMPKMVFLSISLLLNTGEIKAQLSAPDVESVFGGRINKISGYAMSSDSSRIFISTESANSIFYSDIYNPAGSGFAFVTFNKVPCADANDNVGSGIQKMTTHAQSGRLYFAAHNGIYAVSNDLSTKTLIASGNANDLIIVDSVLLYLSANKMYFGYLDSLGNFTSGSGSPINLPSAFGSANGLAYDANNHKIYVFKEGNDAKAAKSSNPFYSLSGSTTLDTLDMTGIPDTMTWKAFGISQQGRVFVGGHSNGTPGSKYVCYSDDDSSWNFVSTGIIGVSSSDFSFAGLNRVYFAKCYSSDHGATWAQFGNSGQQTHPNDGSVFADPNDTLTVYMTSDIGISYSGNGGSIMQDIEDGVEAVQVKDFDMTTDKNTAFIASKAGIRKVSNYTTSPNWSLAAWPSGDGSPYYSIAMVPGDTNRVYCGNVRIYKSLNSGSNWTQVFTPESSPYNFDNVGTIANAIEVCPYDSNIVFAGYELQDSLKGGLFYSMDAGANWDQLWIEVSSDGEDVDVTDIIFSIEGSDTVAYASVKYDISVPQGRSIYRIVKSGSTWNASQNMNSAGTSVGYPITASLEDIALSSTGDTLYTCGTDAGTNHPTVYYKSISGTNKWTPAFSSFSSTGDVASAVTIGSNDTVYVAVENKVYFAPVSASSWSLGYTYPTGTEINFLYFDELLVGTSIGLFGQLGDGTPPAFICTPHPKHAKLNTNDTIYSCSVSQKLKTKNNNRYSTFIWSTGDTAINPSTPSEVNLSNTGWVWVYEADSNYCNTDSVYLKFIRDDIPAAIDTTICNIMAGDTQHLILSNLFGTGNAYSFYESDGLTATAEVSFVLDSNSSSKLSSIIYASRIGSNVSCKSKLTFYTGLHYERLFSADTFFLRNTNLKSDLKIKHFTKSYLWSTGDSSKVTQAYHSGAYAHRIGNAWNCYNQDTVHVSRLNLRLPAKRTVCLGEDFTLSVDSSNNNSLAVWSNGDTGFYSIFNVSSAFDTIHVSLFDAYDMKSASVIIKTKACPIPASSPVLSTIDNIEREESLDEQSVNVYPNPSRSQLIISNNGLYASYVISDMAGRNIISGTLNNEFTSVDVKGLQAGTYVIKIIGEAANMQAKFVKVD